MEQQVERELGGSGMLGGQMEEINQDARAMLPPQRGEVIDRIHAVPQMMTDLPDEFGIALDQQFPIPPLELSAACAERRRFVMKDKGAMRRYRRIAVTIDPADEIVFLVVTGAVNGIEDAELPQDHVLDQHAEANGGRHDLVSWEQVADRHPQPVGLGRRQALRRSALRRSWRCCCGAKRRRAFREGAERTTSPRGSPRSRACRN